VTIPITLPNGEELDGTNPVVIIGPNGSGKTRQSRNLSSPHLIEFVNALRNTRVAPDLPAMGLDQARANYSAQRDQARGQFWELISDFDYMLSQLLAEYSMEAIRFAKQVEREPSTAQLGMKETALHQVEVLWRDVFPGRELEWRDWKPLVASTTSGSTIEYSGNQMSDGEKSALYLAAKVFNFAGGVLVVDEPETHFHSLLAVRLWNALEHARPDVRFVYVTHDLTFALSRHDPIFILASPTAGLRALALDDTLPADVTEALLGSASLSFYASRLVFCEGDVGSYDDQLYGAWFKGQDTVVRPVRGHQQVLRCVEAVRTSGIANSLDAIGIIDRDYYSSQFFDALGKDVHPLRVHEVESLFALPGVVNAVAKHLGKEVDATSYANALRGTVNADQERAIALQRWKAKVEPSIVGIIASVPKSMPLQDLADDMATIFDHSRWPFDPRQILLDQADEVAQAVQSEDITDFLRIVPGKQLSTVAARFVGLEKSSYMSLVVSAVQGARRELTVLSDEIVLELSSYLPDRAVAAQIADQPL
jgi:hypothetical protein